LCSRRLPRSSKFEVFDSVGNVDGGTVDFGFLESAVEHPPGGADEGMAAPIFLVSGLLPDHHDGGVRRAFAEDGLGGVEIKIAALARLNR
jgi:hypothetical protein